MSLIGNGLKLLAKSVSILLGLTAAGSTTDAAIHEEMFGASVCTMTISNEEMNGNSLDKSGLLIKKELAKQSKMKSKNKEENFLECYEAL